MYNNISNRITSCNFYDSIYILSAHITVNITIALICTEHMLSDSIYFLDIMYISILIVVGTCTRSCARARVSRQSRARQSRVSACREAACLRVAAKPPCDVSRQSRAPKPPRVAAKPRAAKPRVRVSRRSRLATRPAGGHS